jgi:hypothetical protein
MHTVFLLFFGLYAVGVSAQDYVVSAKGDTLRGNVKLLTYDIQDRVQLTGPGKKQVFTALEVKTVMMDGELYKTQRYENSYRYMKLLKGGYLSLYAFRPKGQAAYDGRMLIKTTGQSAEVANLTFKKSTAAFVEDCPEVAADVRAGVYSRNELDKLIDQYNACMAGPRPPGGATESPTMVAWQMLQKKVAGLPNFDKQNDVLDLLADIGQKIKNTQPVAGYQLDLLSQYLQGQAIDELENFLDLVKK